MGTPSSKSSSTFPWVGLLTLSALIFTTVTSEFLPTGLLPDIAAEFEVSEAQVGFLVTIFAASVVVSAAPLATLTRRFSRKPLILVVLGVFVLANILAAIAPTYAVLVVARVLGGLTHGLFWAVVGAYSAHLVPRNQIGRAVAITSAGGTAAFVLGVPVGTAIGHLVGWRLAFVALAFIMVILAIMTVRFLPPVQHLDPLKTGEIALPMRKDKTVPAIIVICITVVLLITAHNIFSTYVVPFLIGPGGIDPSAVAGLLFLYGGGGAIGLVLAGAITDRYPRAGLVIATVVVIVMVLVIGLLPHVTPVLIAAILLWGIAFGGIPTMIHARILMSASKRMRDIAAAYLTTSFNAAIGGGALIGGLLLTSYGVGILPFVNAGGLVLAIVFSVLADAWLRRREHVAS
jgi:DHA1 family inner membrane transport protein